MEGLPAFPQDLALLDRRLAVALASGLIEPGLAQRVRLSAYLQQVIYPRKYRAETKAADGAISSDLARPGTSDMSGEALGRLLGLSRAAVGKHIHQLRDRGFAIEASAGSGYRMTEGAGDLLAGEAVIPYLLEYLDPKESGRVGLPYIYQKTCGSTNLVLRQVAGDERGLPTGTVAVTDHQESGRGRLGRGWDDEAGKEVMFSVLLRPSLPPGRAHLLSLAAAMGVALTLEALPGLAGKVKIKWPNDVLIGEGKVCGILVEGSMDADRLHWAVAGIGLNVNSEPTALERAIAERGDEGADSRPRPSSLLGSMGREVPRAPLLAALLCRLGECWRGLEEGSPGVERLLEDLRRLDALSGSMVEVHAGPGRPEVVAAGEAVGIGPEGQLLVRGQGGETVSVVAGDVTVNRRRRVG